jgi:hypothetical protein
VEFIPQSAWVCLEKDENLVEAIQASKIAWKLRGVLNIGH